MAHQNEPRRFDREEDRYGRQRHDGRHDQRFTDIGREDYDLDNDGQFSRMEQGHHFPGHDQGREDSEIRNRYGQYGGQVRDEFQGRQVRQNQGDNQTQYGRRDQDSYRGSRGSGASAQSFGYSRPGAFGSAEEFGQRPYEDEYTGRSSRGFGDWGRPFDSSTAMRGQERPGEFGGAGQDWGRFGESGRGAGHRGKGPKNFSRSDERIMEDANERLMDDDNVDASEIQVQVQNGEVTLSGTVQSKSEKRCAEDCVDNVSGVRNVQNNLRVKESASGGQKPGMEAKKH